MTKTRRILRQEIAIMAAWSTFCTMAIAAMAFVYFAANASNYDARALSLLIGVAFTVGLAFMLSQIAFIASDIRNARR